MAASFSNPRLSTKECERMRGDVIYADMFVSIATVSENFGAVFSSTISRGQTPTSTSGIVYYNDDRPCETGEFSAVLKFKTETKADCYLLGHSDSPVSGFRIKMTDEGYVYANHTTSDDSSDLILEQDLTDGEWHTVSYVVDLATGVHSLYVDDYDVVTDNDTATNGTIGGTSFSTTYQFTGTLKWFKFLSYTIDAEEHANYLNNTLSPQAISVWRCDEICNDTTGNKTWDKTTQLNDLAKGDGSDTDTFPTFDDDKYEFDGVDDYLSSFPDRPDEYTTSATVSEDASILPQVDQHNDDSTVDAITTAGGYNGRLHNLQLFESELTPLQLKQNEFNSLHFVGQILARGVFGDMSVEGTGKAVFFFGQSFKNWSLVSGTSTNTGATQTDSGLEFPLSTSRVELSDESGLRHANGSVVFFGDFDSNKSGGTIIQKGSNYTLSYSPTHLYFNGSSVAYSFDNNTQLAVTWADGFKPQFYVDGFNIGVGNIDANIDDTDTSDIVIGNNSTYTIPSQYELNHVYIGDSPLTESEIKVMMEQSRIIVNDPMEEPPTTIVTWQNTTTSTDIIQNTTTSTDIIQNVTG